MTTISFVSAASANATSLTMPTHQAGDVLIFAAYREGGITPPTIPSGWLSINNTAGVNTNSMSIAYRIATSSSITSGTWTNASQVSCAVYRGTSLIHVGGSVPKANASSLTVSWVLLDSTNVARQNANTWHVGIVGFKANDVNCEVAPTGMTNRTSVKGASLGQLAIHDTNGDVAAWATTGQTYTVGTAAFSRTHIIEIIDTGYTPAGGTARPSHALNQQVVA